jgi:flagellar biosynthesis chaperone FliJ
MHPVRSVSTASSEQVRQPIDRGTVDQWRNYQPWLATLENTLDDARIRYRERPADSLDSVLQH